MRATLLLIVLAACEWNSPQSPDAAGAMPDGHHVPRPDASDDGMMGGATGHLLLTEVAMSPTGGEFVELANPTADPVALDHYYLSDNGNYWKLPAGSVAVTAGDFIVQFPAGASIAPGGVVTVALGTAAQFNTTYGVMPTYSIADATVTRVAGTGTVALTDGGEIVVLFAWDGAADLVKDVDLVLAGNPIASNGLVSKSGATQGQSTYAADADTIKPQATAPATGTSTKRIAAETGHETQDGTGNGITGDDETSEDTAQTWDTTFTAPTPGQIPTL